MANWFSSQTTCCVINLNLKMWPEDSVFSLVNAAFTQLRNDACHHCTWMRRFCIQLRSRAPYRSVSGAIQDNIHRRLERYCLLVNREGCTKKKDTGVPRDPVAAWR